MVCVPHGYYMNQREAVALVSQDGADTRTFVPQNPQPSENNLRRGCRGRYAVLFMW